MKWSNVQITDEKDKVYTGIDALRFVEDKCKPIAINTNWDGLIEVNTNSPSASTEDKEVRSVLFSRLKGKVKSLRFFKGTDFAKVTHPVGRAIPNLINVSRAKLKVEFIFKRDLESPSPRKFLEDSIVTVTASCAGSTGPLTSTITLTEDTNKGVADFGVVDPGEYAITPDYSKLDKCKYDWTDETRNVVLEPLSVETVTFEVEPLYQKVQLIAHCLLTIPDFMLVLSEEDKKKVEFKETDGKKSFEFKSKLEPFGNWSLGLIDSEVKAKANIKVLAPKLLTMKKKENENAYWRLEDIKDSIKDKIEIGEQKGSDPDSYAFSFKPRFEKKDYKLEDLEAKWWGKYHGLEDDKADMRARIELVKATLEYAYTKAKDDPTILKVFMVPECFFQGRYGSYRVEDADYLFTRLLNLVGDVQWRDWIFVFGTVNLTFSEGKPGIDEGIREMMNYSPVIRGGLGSADKSGGSGGQSDEHLRLIQKLVNSAELLDKSNLVHHDKEARVPSVNEEVQFQATQGEEKVGVILADLLDKNPYFKDRKSDDFKDGDFGERHGLTPKQWAELKTELEKDVKALGLTRVVRSIRACKIESTPDDLSKWDDYSHPIWKKILELYCREKNLSEIPLESKSAKLDYRDYCFAAERKAGPWLTLEKAESLAPCKKLVFGLEICADHASGRLKDLVQEQLTVFQGTILEYLEKIPDNDVRFTKEEREKENARIELENAKRKSQNIIAEGDKARIEKENIATQKRNETKPNVTIDIQLVPSAGMIPTKLFIAARKDGYCFNCDGWNKGIGTGVNLLTEWFDGPEYANMNPVTPHTAIAKGGGVPLDMETFKPERIKLESVISPVLGKDILNKSGMGELHVYDELDLPKS